MSNSRRLAGWITLFLISCISQTPLFAQGQLDVFNVDVSKYPTIKANVYALDSLGLPISGLTVNDVKVVEDNVDVVASSLTCPPATNGLASATISFDISTSMMPVFGSAKITATKLIELLRRPTTEVAILSATDVAYINQDMTTDRAKAIKAIDPLAADGNNDFKVQLLDGRAGLLSIAQGGIGRRCAILLTDAHWTALDTAALRDCQEICAQYQIRFYAVVYGAVNNDPTGIVTSLRALATSSGGRVIEGITNDAIQLRNLAYFLEALVEGYDPCQIEWTSNGGCVTSRSATVSIPSRSLSDIVRYPIPVADSLHRAQLEGPSFIKLGPVLPGKKRDTTITVTAINRDVMLYRVVSDNPRFALLDTGAQPLLPDTIAKGASFSFVVRFTPTDSLEQFARLTLVSDACDAPIISMSGGFHRRGEILLSLVQPNGGEQLMAGTDTALSWTGVAANEPVRLEYSTNAGVTWKKIAENATGFRYPWRVPSTPSNRCLARVTQMYNSPLLMTIDNKNGAVLEVDETSDGKLLLTVDKDSINIWDAKTGSLWAQMYHPQVRSAQFAFNNASMASAGLDGQVRVWNTQTGAMTKVLSWNATPLYSIRCSGPSALTAGHRSNSTSPLMIWDMPGIAAVNPMDPNLTLPIDYQSAEFISVGEVVAGGNSKNVPIFNISTGKVVRTLTYSGSNVTTIARSRNGKRLLIGGNAGVDIYNLTTYTLEVNVATGPVTWGDFSPDGNTIAVAGKGADVELWEPYTSTLAGTFHGHTGKTICVRYSHDGTRLFSTSVDGSVKIWDLEEALIPADGSDSLWAIISSRAETRNIDMGAVLVGTARDSNITSFIHNAGSAPIHVQQVRIFGPDFLDFTIISTPPPFDVEPGQSYPVEFRFRPGGVGPRIATIDIVMPDTTMRISITGVGVDPLLRVAADIVDFGPVQTGNVKDSTIDVAVTNISAGPVRIDSTVSIGPDTRQFSILSGGGSFTLLPDSSRTVTLRFAPIDAGRTNGRIAFYYDGAGSPAIMQLFGEGVTDLKPVIVAPNELSAHAFACKADTAIVDVALRNRGAAMLDVSSLDITGTNAADFSLATMPFIPFSIAPNKDTVVRLRFIPTAAGDRSAMMTIHSNASDSLATVLLTGRGDSIAINTSFHGIDLGDLCPGEVANVAITVTNLGTTPTHVTGVTDAQMQLSASSWSVDNGQSFIANISVVSTNEGAYQGLVTFTDSICGASISVMVKAQIERPQVDAPATTLMALLGSFIDSALTLSNHSTRDVMINDVTSDDPHFAVLPGQLPMAIPAGGLATLVVRFTPTDNATVTSMLHGIGEPCVTSTIPVTGMTGEPRVTTIALPFLSAVPGDTVSIPVVLRDAGDIQRSGATGITTSLHLNASLLLPIAPTPPGVVINRELVIPLVLPITPPSDSVLIRLRFIALLGNDTTSPLVLERPEAIGGVATIVALPGQLKLTGICGLSDRLMELVEATVLKPIAPNPISSTTSIEFETPDEQHVQLYITDLYGRRVASLYDGEAAAGTHSVAVDISQISSGVYECTLQTPWRVVSRVIVVRR